ncbi:hypothetical protein RhiirC2_789745 [Rhizophagus irregularis]|uniref:Uncharacterized protein n=1 Tax=Rhizophagus irregularis TaxID=588596 RepID=A0A2N1MMJ1_9GLOM|nr:hypothetical protein RhiirC2_789745 [Rhizophagus irregularis]
MLLRLRQICNHTQLLCKRQINHINGIDNKEEIGNLNDFRISSKIEALVEFLNQNNDDDKSVVFSQWTSFLDLIEIAFKDANVKFKKHDLIFQAFEKQQSNESSNIDKVQLKKDL